MTSILHADGHRIVVELGHAEVIWRRVGPTPWVVLEALAGRSPRGKPVVEVESSTRDLAEVVGLSKDTVARALRTLASVGLVRRVDRRNDRTGQFTATTYVVDLAAAGLTVQSEPLASDMAAVEAEVVGPSTPPAAEAPRVVRRPRSPVEQNAVRSAAGSSADELPGVEHPTDPARDSERSSAQLSLLS